MPTAFTRHGGRVDTAAEAYRQTPLPWLDLSTGISPFAWTGLAMDTIDLRALPSVPALAALEAAARAAFGLGAGAICALPGTEIGLRMLRTLDFPEPHVHVAPSYGTHADALPKGTGLAFGDLAATSAQGGTVLLANPNNPDGRVIPPAELLALARKRGGWVIVDEAFADAVPGASVLPHLTDRDRVLVFRSFGKFFGLAGLRLGFVCGPAEMVDQLRARLGSWPVSSAAIAVGTAAYRDTGWIQTTREMLASAAVALDAVLRRHGLEPIGACPLFRLVEATRAAALFDRLARAGILTRPFDYAPNWLRIGLPRDAAALDRLDRALSGS